MPEQLHNNATRCRPSSRFPLRSSAALRSQFGTTVVEKLKLLCEPDSKRALVAMGKEAVAVVVPIAMLARLPILWLPVLVHLGVRGRYIGNLMHEAQHRKLLRSPRLNRVVGHIFALLTFNSFSDYDDIHSIHHRDLGQAGDPKVIAYEQKGLAGAARKSRVGFLVEVLVVPLLGVLLVRAIASVISRKNESRYEVLARFLFWLSIAVVAWLTGSLMLLAVYVAAMLTVRPYINHLTDIANHGGLIPYETDEVRMTRGFTGGWVTRYLFGGSRDDLYHVVHHWAPGVVWFNYAAAAEILASEFPRWGEVPFCDGFIVSRRPGVPSVLDDIYRRLHAAA